MPSTTTPPNTLTPEDEPLSLIKEIGLILGLKGEAYEGAYSEQGRLMTIQRFQTFYPEYSEPLAFHPITKYQNEADFYEPIRQHGDLQSIKTGWNKHGFTFHLIKEDNKWHLIYVNRGERHENANQNEPSVTVFTFADAKKMSLYVDTLIEILRTEQKTSISQYLTLISSYKNQELSSELKKSEHKVGNCAAANSNITWHFALAAADMKKNKVSFSQAYKNTKPVYKNMRMEDRAKAFCDLMTKPELELVRQKALSQTMKKMARKDRKIAAKKKSGKDTIPFLVDRLYKREPYAVNTLLKNICQTSYDNLDNHQLLWICACARILKEKNAFSTEENQLVNQYISTIKILNRPDLNFAAVIRYLNHKPVCLNIIPQKALYFYALNVNETTLSHLSMTNIKYLLKTTEKDLSRGDFFRKFSAEQIYTLIQDNYLDELKKHLGLVTACLNKLSDQQIRSLIQNKHLDHKDLSENQSRNYCNYCKVELLKILQKNATSTQSIAKKNTASNLIHQLHSFADLKDLNQLKPIFHHAEYIFSHPRNPFVFHSKTARDDFSELRALMSYNEKPHIKLPYLIYKQTISTTSKTPSPTHTGPTTFFRRSSSIDAKISTTNTVFSCP